MRYRRNSRLILSLHWQWFSRTHIDTYLRNWISHITRIHTHLCALIEDTDPSIPDLWSLVSGKKILNRTRRGGSDPKYLGCGEHFGSMFQHARFMKELALQHRNNPRYLSAYRWSFRQLFRIINVRDRRSIDIIRSRVTREWIFSYILRRNVIIVSQEICIDQKLI